MGGEAAGGAFVLARLGVATKLGGNRLGDDRASTETIRLLEEAGVDCGGVTTVPGAGPVTEVVISSGENRTIFGTYGRLHADQAWAEGDEDDVRSSRIVCLDPFFGEASLQVARWSREAGVPYVTVDTPLESEIAHHAEVLILSEEFAARTFDMDPQAVLGAYGRRCGGLVILTRGEEPFLYGRPGSQPATATPFSVQVRDTAGAGDSFRAGVIYGMLRGYDDGRLVETGAAVAAMVCRGVPGVLHSPTVAELEAFLGEQRR